jgi:hypothetical protein
MAGSNQRSKAWSAVIVSNTTFFKEAVIVNGPERGSAAGFKGVATVTQTLRQPACDLVSIFLGSQRILWVVGHIETKAVAKDRQTKSPIL